MLDVSKEELVRRFSVVLKSDMLFGSFWTNEDRGVVDKLLDELAVQLAEVAMLRGKPELPPGSGIDWLLRAGADESELKVTLSREDKIREVTNAYEKAMGFPPLEWAKMDRLQKFLCTKTVEEIKTFAKWSKRQFSSFTPTKARLFPNVVIDLWLQAFEETEESHTNQDTINEVVYGRKD